ncbi:MAG TPA: D-2-hydroxyacid dehydrogenase family protein [Pseudolabrys sp.]|nr:D-2-hydroxyacid dehydrogenase family protein [Pseudolabrys sp.]
MSLQGAILDDYQSVAMKTADWSSVSKDVNFKVFTEGLGAQDKVIAALKDCAVVCLMRERTLFGKDVIDALPNLKLIVTSGMRNAAIDVNAASARGIPVCGTDSLGSPTSELTIGLILELARKIGIENARLKAGAKWQSTLGIDLYGKTLGIIGLGKLGTRVAAVGNAFGMKVIAWSQNLTAEKATASGATLVTKEELLRQSDFVTMHVQLSARTKGLIGAAELAVMKPTAYFINTSRGPVADEKAIEAALKGKKIAGAAIDTYDIEPLAADHPFRKLDNIVITPHLGYVTAENYHRFYGQMVENIRAWLDGKPIRVIPSK